MMDEMEKEKKGEEEKKEKTTKRVRWETRESCSEEKTPTMMIGSDAWEIEFLSN